MSKIITDYVRPPIPSRNNDWIAYRDGDEEGIRGWGKTEGEAIADLAEQILDAEEMGNCPQCHGPVHESGFCPGCKECVA